VRRAALGLAAALACAPSPSFAEPACGALGATQAVVSAWGGPTLAALPPAEAEALKAVLTAGDPAALWMLGAEAEAAPIRGGEFAVALVVDGRACDLMVMSAEAMAALGALGRRGLRLGLGL